MENWGVHLLLDRVAPGRLAAIRPDGDDAGRTELAEADLPEFVRREEAASRPRWVWDDTRGWYPQLLQAGVRVERCVDLRLSHAILRASTLSAGSALATAAAGPWDAARVLEEEAQPQAATLFDLDHPAQATRPSSSAEFAAQQEAVAGSADPGRLRLLLAAESAGALIAAEMQHAGLPYSVERHDELLRAALGPRPRFGRPEALEAPDLNPDSPPELLKALQRAGLMVTSTRSWELRELDHPAIPAVLRYKK